MKSGTRQERKSYGMLRMSRAISRAMDGRTDADKNRAIRWASAWGLIGGIRSDSVRLRHPEMLAVADPAASLQDPERADGSWGAKSPGAAVAASLASSGAAGNGQQDIHVAPAARWAMIKPRASGGPIPAAPALAARAGATARLANDLDDVSQ